MTQQVATPLLIALLLASCSETSSIKKDRAQSPGPEMKTTSFSLTSSAFLAGNPIPKIYAYKGEGDNISPPLAWSDPPKATQSFALIVDDPDAPSPTKPRPEPWVHWVLYDIRTTQRALAAGQSGVGEAGKNDFGVQTWSGPFPPKGSGKHRYVFRLYALDTKLSLASGSTKKALLGAMKGHILAQAELIGTYERP